MITLPPLSWFCQRQNGRLVTNTYTDSFETSPKTGIHTADSVYPPIFKYEVEVVPINDCEQESILKAECSVTIHRQSGSEEIRPAKTIQMVGVTEQNLIFINDWLKDEVALHLMGCHNKLPNLAEVYKIPEDVQMVDYYVRNLNDCRRGEKPNEYRRLYLNMEILPEGIDRVMKEYNEWSSALSSPLHKKAAEILDFLRIVIQCFTHGISFLPPDVNVSHHLCFVPENGSIRIPFNWYVGLKREFSIKIMQERKKRPFSSKEDFKTRMEITFDDEADGLWGETVGIIRETEDQDGMEAESGTEQAAEETS